MPAPIPQAGGASARTTPVGPWDPMWQDREVSDGISPAASPLSIPPSEVHHKIVLTVRPTEQAPPAVPAQPPTSLAFTQIPAPYVPTAAIPTPVPALGDVVNRLNINVLSIPQAAAMQADAEPPLVPFMSFAPKARAPSMPAAPPARTIDAPAVPRDTNNLPGRSSNSAVGKDLPSYALPLTRSKAPTPAQEAYTRLHTPITAVIAKEKADRERAEQGRAIRDTTLNSTPHMPFSSERMSGISVTRISTPSEKDSGGRTGRSTPLESASTPGSTKPNSRKFDMEAPELKSFIAHGRREGVPVTRVKASYGTEQKQLIAAAHKSLRRIDNDEEEG